MPIGSRKLSAYSNKYRTGAGTAFTPSISISESYGGSSGGFAVDYTIITYDIVTNLPNTTIDYEIVDLGSNLTSADFTDNTLTGNVTTDANGNVSLAKTITSSIDTGHKSFYMRLQNPADNTIVVGNSANTYLYEMIGMTATGGNITINNFAGSPSNVADFEYWNGANAFIGGMTRHVFDTPGNTTFTITDYGNYTGNVGVWENQFRVGANTNVSIWANGVGFKSLIVGGGGFGNIAGGGSGDVATLFHTFDDVSAGSYTMTVGPGATSNTSTQRSFTVSPPVLPAPVWTINDDEKTVIFAGNANLSLTAYGGGNDTPLNTSRHGGSSAGGQVGIGRAYASRSVYYYPAGNTYYAGFGDLVDWSSLPASSWTEALKANVVQLYANEGGLTTNPGEGSGGGSGAFEGADNDVVGANGICLYYTPTSSYPNQPYPDNATLIKHYDSPLVTYGSDVDFFAAGGGGSPSGTDGYSTLSYGNGGGASSAGQDGLIVIAYPYSTDYRFITNTEIT